MDLLQLKYFVALAEKEHLNKTAEELIITPSTLSSSLSRLEKELGIKLFDRIGRNIRLNKFGQIYYKYCKEVFTALNNASAEINDAQDKTDSGLTIGLTNPLLWQGPFQELRALHPDIHFQLIAFDTGTENSDISNLDLIIASPDSLRDPSLASKTLFYDEVLLAVPPKHRLAKRKSIDLSEAKDEWFVNSLRNTSFRQYCDNLCLQAGFEPKTQIECDYILRSKMMISENMICLITRRGYLTGLYNEAVLIPLSFPRCMRPQAIFWHKDRYQTKAAQMIKSFVIKYYENYDPLHLKNADKTKNQ